MTRHFRIVAQNLGCNYHRNDGTEVILSDVSFSVEPGRVLCVLGINGSGKTTLLSAIAGLITPSRGMAAMECLLETDAAAARVAFLHQDYRQTNLPWASAVENVTYPLTFRGVPATERRDRGRKVLATLLPEVAPSRSMNTLSGGQQQLIAIARALVSQPDVVLADEPLSAADAVHQMRAVRYINEEFGARELPMIWVSHDIDEALLLGDQIGLLGRHRCGFAQFIPNPAPRPRDASSLANGAVVELKRTILEFLIADSENHAG